jgi:hypothetical protein
VSTGIAKLRPAFDAAIMAAVPDMPAMKAWMYRPVMA